MRTKKRVVWNPGQGRAVMNVDPESSDAPPFTGPGATSGVNETWTNLMPGSLVSVKAHGFNLRTWYGYDGGRPPVPFLDTAHYGEPLITSGSIGMYLGAIRTNEHVGGKTGVVRMVRHIFSFDGAKYVVYDLSTLEPVA